MKQVLILCLLSVLQLKSQATSHFNIKNIESEVLDQLNIYGKAHSNFVHFDQLPPKKQFAHSPLEKEVSNQLNIYRKQHGLNPANLDTTISKIARYHANYVLECSKVNHSVNYDKLPHDEQFDIKGFVEKNFEQRAAMAPDKNIWGEIMIACMWIKSGSSNIEIAKSIIKSFDGSPKHKEIMLASDTPKFPNIVGISVIKKVSTIDEYVVNIDFGVLTQ